MVHVAHCWLCSYVYPYTDNLPMHIHSRCTECAHHYVLLDPLLVNGGGAASSHACSPLS